MTYAKLPYANWNPLTIALMIGGFVIFWPLGLAVIAYVLWGDRIVDILREMSSDFRAHGKAHFGGGAQTSQAGGNAAFEAYRQAELKRLEEERRKLDTMRAEFDAFVDELRRAKDKDEFDRFMRDHGRG